MKLRDYEADWVRRINLSKSRRILVVGPTGSGKTVVAVQLIREALQRNARVLFLAHRVELINQAKQRLIDHGVPVCSIGTIRGEEKENRKASVQVASVQTLARRALPKAQLIFVDEAHHASARSYRNILDAYPKALVFGLTATPYRLDGKPLGDLFEDIVESAKASELISAGWLNRPRVWTVPLDERPDVSEVKVTGGDFNVGELERASNRKTLVGSIVEHWKRLAEGRPTVCYAVSVKHAKRIAKAFRDAGITSCVLSAETPDDERASFLRLLRAGELKVLVNCMVLTEGWDCPEARCAIVARSTMSQSLWFQMTGRIMRKGDIEPIVLDHAGNAIMHPLPGTDIEHSLEEPQARRRGKGQAREKTCPDCGSSMFIGIRVCPNCGHEFWTGEPPEEVQIDLIEVTGERVIFNRRCRRCGQGKRLGKSVNCERCLIEIRGLTPGICCNCGKKLGVASKNKKGKMCLQCIGALRRMPKPRCIDCGVELGPSARAKGSIRCVPHYWEHRRTAFAQGKTSGNQRKTNA